VQRARGEDDVDPGAAGARERLGGCVEVFDTPTSSGIMIS